MLLNRVLRANRSFLPVQRRFQSSFTFSNNQSLMQKEQPKDERRREKKADTEAKESGNGIKNKKKTQVELVAKKRRDYSWLPKAPPTNQFKPLDVRTSVFYSGYRPVFLDAAEKKDSGSTLFDFAMKLEALGEPLPWVSSATGTEYFDEWDKVPASVIKKLRPFDPPSTISNAQRAESQRVLRQQRLVSEKQKLTNRAKGRKKPILGLLRMVKSWKSDS
ncbi:LAMI_0F04192g1_1 [Lachancea mirantina]|uniref:LAMI_0F04192g1_1 n=1 Tax=Lachancea mirantina TaxID=1230905 RepID=A0A1G4JXU6_9SACH|nr:LAMI_0F04192g1_1 [Lachancea mirantina]